MNNHPLLLLLEALTRAHAASSAATVTAPPEHGKGGPTAEGTPFDQGRLLLQLFEESQRINRAFFRLLVQPQIDAQMALLQAMTGASPPNGNETGHRQPEDELFAALSRAQGWVLQNPLAAQAVFSALVAEGRQYSRTDAGARWARAFAESDLIRKGRLVWEATTLNLLEERAESALPTTYLEVLRRAVGTRNFEDLLARLRQRAREGEE